MLASTPTKDYVALRNPPTISPSYRHRYHTPPRILNVAPAYDSLMHSPSPLRQRPLFPSASNALEADDLFSQSPYKAPAPAQNHRASYPSKPQPISADDDEGFIFLSPSPTSLFIPVSSSQSLSTPVKQAPGVAGRPALSLRHLNTPAPSVSATHVGGGTKRKQCSRNTSTPDHSHTFTPLRVAVSKTVDPHATSCFMFDRLAPLDAPKFVARTPQTKAETEAYLRRQTATLTKLKLADLKDSDDEFSPDPCCDLDDELDSFRPTVHRQLANKKEVADVSPGGHVIKRRARSRPLSAELLESAFRSSTSPSKVSILRIAFCHALIIYIGTVDRHKVSHYAISRSFVIWIFDGPRFAKASEKNWRCRAPLCHQIGSTCPASTSSNESSRQRQLCVPVLWPFNLS